MLLWKHLVIIAASVGLGYQVYTMANAVHSNLAWGYFSLSLFGFVWAFYVLVGLSSLERHLQKIRELLERHSN